MQKWIFLQLAYSCLNRSKSSLSTCVAVAPCTVNVTGVVKFAFTKACKKNLSSFPCDIGQKAQTQRIMYMEFWRHRQIERNINWCHDRMKLGQSDNSGNSVCSPKAPKCTLGYSFRLLTPSQKRWRSLGMMP